MIPRRPSLAAALALVLLLPPSSSLPGQEEKKNWLYKGTPKVGTFEKTESVAHPWTGVDAQGFLRKSVSMPATHPFVTKSNQFSYAWMGWSASFVDMDGDGLPDIVSPDGAGIFWCWKNTGSPGQPAFGHGEVMPLLVDDERSQFKPIIRVPVDKKDADKKKELSPSQQSDKRKIDDKRAKELEKLAKRNNRKDKEDQQSEDELKKQVEELFPYPWEQEAENAIPIPQGRFKPNSTIPPDGLSCTLNTFRRLRAIATPGDWNNDKLTDFLVGDSGGTVYFARNSGKPGQPQFGHYTRSAHAIPLKVAPVIPPGGRNPVPTPVEFMNYAMPFVCDWNGNGVPDLLVGEGTYSVNTVRIFHDAARSSLQYPPKEEALYVGDERTFLAPFAHDWDGDGDLDLFVCDDKGSLTVHRRDTPTGPLAEPFEMQIDGGNEVLAYCTPQPCDWNNDGIMDLIWGEPFGRIMIALGKEKGGKTFAAAEAVRSIKPAEILKCPSIGSFTGTPGRVKDEHGPKRNGGTANAERYYRTDGTTRENEGGFPDEQNNKMFGLQPSWDAEKGRTLAQDVFNRDSTGNSGKHSSWAVAPHPGDIWEVVEDAGAPGAGNTLLLRWHDWNSHAIFKTRPVPPLHWTRGCSIFFSNGKPGPFTAQFTKGPMTIRFHMKLTGNFTRLDMIFNTNWGPLGANGKPPAEGGSFSKTISPPPTGKWFEFVHTEPPGSKYQRGLDGSVFIGLLGQGEVRLRDVRVHDGN